MPYTQVTSGGYITSDWANTYVNDQVVATYSSTTDRNTNGPGTPIAGMLSVLTTNTVTEGLYEYTSAGVWRLPWNMPWGNVTISATPGALPSLSTSQVNSSAFTWSAINHRNYLVTVTAELSNLSAVNTVTTLFVENSAGTDLKNPLIRWTPRNVNDQISSTGSFIYTSTATGTQTWNLAATTTAGTTGQTITPYSVIITDVGPSGAPA